jgi:hypothetical protein
MAAACKSATQWTNSGLRRVIAAGGLTEARLHATFPFYSYRQKYRFCFRIVGQLSFE